MTVNPRIESFVAFGCVHRPIHDETAIEWLIQRITELQPKVIVNLGDCLDVNCLSTYAKEEEYSLTEEYDSCDNFLARVRRAAPKARRIWLEGNHEERMRRAEHKNIRDILDYRKRIPEAKAWRHLPYEYSPRGVFSLGQVTFYHGFTAGRGTVKSESVKLGVPYGLTVSAHTHRPHPVHRISMGVTPLPYWHVNAGTMIKPDVKYMQAKDDSLWGSAIVHGWANTRRRFNGKQHWHAEMVLYRMNWDVGGEAA